MEETRAKRSMTEKRLRQSLFSPNQVLPGLDEMRDIAEELEQKKRELQMKEYGIRRCQAAAVEVSSDTFIRHDSLLRAKDEEMEQLRSELDALREGRKSGREVEFLGYFEESSDYVPAAWLSYNNGLASRHSKVSVAIDSTFEDALAQLSAVEAMLTACAPGALQRASPKSTELASTEEVRCSTDMLLVNPNRGFGWHQDNQNGPIEFDDAVRWWVAMDACGQDGIGAPEYLLGSHRNKSVSSDAAQLPCFAAYSTGCCSGATPSLLVDGDLSTYPRSTRYTPEPGDLIIWNARTIHRIVAPPGQKWVDRRRQRMLPRSSPKQNVRREDGTQRRAIGGTMAKAGAKYINKGGASGISDLAGHTQKNGEELGGPYFPRIFPERVPEEEAGQFGSMIWAPIAISVRQKQQRMQQVLLRNCFFVLPNWLKPVLFPSPLQGQGLRG
eukprot:s2299_g10.t1